MAEIGGLDCLGSVNVEQYFVSFCQNVGNLLQDVYLVMALYFCGVSLQMNDR